MGGRSGPTKTTDNVIWQEPTQRPSPTTSSLEANRVVQRGWTVPYTLQVAFIVPRTARPYLGSRLVFGGRDRGKRANRTQTLSQIQNRLRRLDRRTRAATPSTTSSLESDKVWAGDWPIPRGTAKQQPGHRGRAALQTRSHRLVGNVFCEPRGAGRLQPHGSSTLPASLERACQQQGSGHPSRRTTHKKRAADQGGSRRSGMRRVGQ